MTTEPFPEVEFAPVSRAQIVSYLQISGDPNVIHSDAAAAEMAGLPDTPVPGLLIMALMERALRQWHPNDRIEELSLTFAAAVYPDAILTAQGAIAKREKTTEGEKIVVRVRIFDSNRKMVGIGAADVFQLQ